MTELATRSMERGSAIKPFTLVSADSHVAPRPEDYLDYLDPKYRDEFHHYLADMALFRSVIEGLDVYPSEDDLKIMDTRRAMRNGGNDGQFDPYRRLREAEQDGVAAEILHPGGNTVVATVPFFDSLNGFRSPELRAAGAIAHNRWVTDYASVAPKRLLGIHCTYPWPDVHAAAETCRVAAEAGAAGVYPAQQAGIPGDPCPAFYDPSWDPFWAACQEYELAVQIHITWGIPQGAIQQVMRENVERANRLKESPGEASDANATATSETFDSFGERSPLWQLMLGGVFDRFPRLRVAFAEIHGDWVPGTLKYLDSLQDRHGHLMKLRPTEYWERHCAVGASLMRSTDVSARHEIGIDKLMFGTDFPHVESSWPNTVDWLRVTASSLPEHEARAIMGENAISFYRLDREELERVAERVGPFRADILGDQHVDPRLVDNFHARAGILKTAVNLHQDELVAAVDRDALAAAKARAL